jgi:hypothetical protein
MMKEPNWNEITRSLGGHVFYCSPMVGVMNPRCGQGFGMFCKLELKHWTISVWFFLFCEFDPIELQTKKKLRLVYV